MSHALNVPEFMTLQEFLVWDAPWGARWQLVDGVPTAMAPASETHATIQSEIGYLLAAHLRVHRPGCRVLSNPGVVPRAGAESNFRIPDLGVTCSPPRRDALMTEAPILLVEVLSPSNRAETWGNIWTYTTIPSVTEILVVRTDAVGVRLLRRGADGTWPAEAMVIEDGDVTLASLGMTVPVTAFYVGTWLAAPGAG